MSSTDSNQSIKNIETGLALMSRKFRELDELTGILNAGKKAELAEASAKLAFSISKEMFAELKRVSSELAELQADVLVSDVKVGGSE